MIYEIEGKPYIKTNDFYAEVELVNGVFKPTKKLHKIYCSEAKNPKAYTFEEYKKYKKNKINL